MFCIFFIISLFSLARADLQSLWTDAGCTSEGLLSPDNLPHFWTTILDQEEYITEIVKGIQAGDRMSSISCRGTNEVPQVGSYDGAFHLLWECADKENCILPPVHALCLRTLRTVHPDAEIHLWSMSLAPESVHELLEEINADLKHYDLTFFDGLPFAAKEASKDIQTFFPIEKDAYSHWSDLFRAAVLYKFGGVYTDLDSIWLRPISLINGNSKAWIPSTPTSQANLENMDVITLGNKKWFLEGGIMQFEEPESPFLWRVLSEFPKYTQEIADCWACVGPRQLTRVYNEFIEESNLDLPDMIDSQKVFGASYYRNYFYNMHDEFDPFVWNNTMNDGIAAAHMFTGTPQGGIKADSTISHFFSVGGVSGAETRISASWREVKERRTRRDLLSSLYYLSAQYTYNQNNAASPQSQANYAAAQAQALYGSAFAIGNSEVQLSPSDYAVTSIDSEIALEGSMSSISNQVAWLEDCTNTLPQGMECVSIRDGSIILTIRGQDKAQMEAVVNAIDTEGITVLETSYNGTPVNGGGSVVVHAGDSQVVTSTVTLACTPQDSDVDEVRNIYYSGFGVALSGVQASIVVGTNDISVTVRGINPDSVTQDAAQISVDVVQSNLCSGSTVSAMNLPKLGSTTASFVVEVEVISGAEFLSAQFELLDVILTAFDIAALDVETKSTFKTHGIVNCAVAPTFGDVYQIYIDELSAMFDGREVWYDPNGSGEFYVISSNFDDALQARYYMANNRASFSFSNFCFWVEDTITLCSENSISKFGETYTDMEADMNTMKNTFATKPKGYEVKDDVIVTEGTQAYGACSMLRECQSDYQELYSEAIGDLDVIPEAKTEDMDWWWRFQFDRHAVSGYMDNVKLYNGFFVYKVNDDEYVNTCVQHDSDWHTFCDSSVGICSGGNTYGFAFLQAQTLKQALDNTSKRHKNCPFGCSSVQADTNWALYNEVLSETAGAALTQQVDDLCILGDKYYLWSDPLSLTDTCVGYSSDEKAPCALSAYTFCPAIDENEGLFVYGDTSEQAQALKKALSTSLSRHPQCL